LNDYSANPEQIYQWLKSAQAGFEMCESLARDLNLLKRKNPALYL
jgi:hypothetical protein